MKYQWNYGDEVLNLPAKVREYLPKASELQIKTLLMLTSADFCEKAARPAQMIAGYLGADEKDVENAIAFWKDKGILGAPSAADKNAEAAGKRRIIAAGQEDAHFAYTTEELNAVLDEKPSLKNLIDECSQLIGKTLNTFETTKIIFMEEYYGFEESYILEIVAYCAGTGKNNMAYISKMAAGLFEEGITNSRSFAEKTKKIREIASFEAIVRRQFAIGERTLTKKEQSMIAAWDSYGYGQEVVEIAYERTVNATGKASLPYADTMIKKWHEAGLKDVEQVRQYLNSSEANGKNGSFAEQDFFSAALERSLKKKETEG